MEKWTGDERQRVLPRIENAKYITFVNESHSQMASVLINKTSKFQFKLHLTNINFTLGGSMSISTLHACLHKRRMFLF